ncbi:MAG: DUF885 domain-containing protein, partial [Bacteroidetes bacterium]|nr:DUF885 domain-containing protein [Bacteroidota bacterium]
MATLLLALILFTQSTMTPQAAQSSPWDEFVKRFMEKYFELNPDFAVYQGRHEYDGMFPDWTTEGLKKKVEWLKKQRNAALAFDAKSLDERQAFERDYLISTIDKDVFWLEAAELPYRNPTFYNMDPNVYVARPYAPLETRLKAYTKYAKNVPKAAEQIRKNLRTPLPKTYIDIGRITFGGLASYFENDVPGVFKVVKNEALLIEFRSANRDAIQAMKSLDSWLEQQKPKATNDFALGAKQFSQMLSATEGVNVSLDELARIGKQDLDRNLAALKEACAAFGPGTSIQHCIQAVNALKPMGGPVEGARRQLSGLRDFLVQKSLVSIPGTEEAHVEESPPYQRWNSAYIDIPGPFEKNLPSVYYIAPPDTSWTLKEREDYIPGESDLLYTSVHEVWPGHFLQFLHSNRSPSKFGQVFVGYAFAEGWAHYAEEMMWEMGLGNGDPEQHIGQLLNALLRNVRYLSAIGLHTGKMTVEQSEKMFREQAYQDAG